MTTGLRHLVVVIPGIGGSVLADPTRREPDRIVWSAGWKSIGDAVVDPDRLDIARDLQPIGLTPSLTVVPFLKTIHGYERTWATVTSTFPNAPTDSGDPSHPNLDARVVAFPYDFRRGVEHAAAALASALRPRIERLGGETTVVLVGHSMGGLVARRWAAEHDGEGRCRGILALGSPFRGAPKALDVVVNGVYWGSRHLQRRGLSGVVQQWPGLHDLVPIDDRVADGHGGWSAPWELHDLPGFDAITRARAQHVETRSWWSDSEREVPPLLAVTGHGHRTRSTITWDGTRLSVGKDGLPGERDGDGTVPVFSSVPPEWSGSDATSRMRPCGETHGAINHTGRLREYLLLLNSGAPPPTRGHGEGFDFLGFDVEPLAEPGERITGTLRFGGEDLPPLRGNGAVAVTASLQAEDTNADHWRRLDVHLSDADRFVVDAPTGVEGVVKLEAVVDLPVGRRRAEEVVVVLGAEG